VTVWSPTPRPARGVVSWNVNTACNYRCSYCTQRFSEDRGRWARDVPRFLEAFAALPGAWEVKLSGGEPFVHPRFLELVAGLAALDVRVSVVTNFSAPREELHAFLDAAGDQLGVISCSLHLEYVDEDEAPGRRDSVPAFLRRCQEAQARLRPGSSLCVTCVATRANLPRLAALRARFAEAGVVFKVQPEKQDRDVIAYRDDERAQLLALGGHNLTGEIAPDFHDRPCWAGSRYFILDDRGEAYRCYPARRFHRGTRPEYLGNFLDGTFQLVDEPRPCPYRYCNCTVPIERGMMPRSPA
jgi:MoaA/NifB/PqqE/SkfB family radical SAM enzyme